MSSLEEARCPNCSKYGLNYLGYCFFCQRVTVLPLEVIKKDDAQLKQAVLQAIEQGLSHNEIKKKFHIGSRTLYSILEEAGLVTHRKPLTQEEKEEIIKAYKEGVKVADICKKFHRTTRTVMKILRSAGVKLRSEA